MAGTIVGATLATLLVRTFRLDPVAIASLIALFAWLAYSLVNVNYGLFAIFLTAYIVFLLDFAGLSTQVVVAHRTLNTALGGGLALLSYSTVLLRRWWHPEVHPAPPLRPPSLDIAAPPKSLTEIEEQRGGVSQRLRPVL